jgi:hypothetical protein
MLVCVTFYVGMRDACMLTECSVGGELSKEEGNSRLAPSSTRRCGWFFLEFCPGSDICSIVFCIDIAPLQGSGE